MDITAIIKKLGFLFLCVLFLGCPRSDDDCDDMGSSTRIENLITLTPIQETYNQGDEVTLKVDIPAINTYFGNEINLLTETNDYSARLVVSFSQLFANNGLNFIKGNQSDWPNWFNMPYNSETGNYELELIVTLNRVGSYSFVTGDTIEFIGDDCDRFFIDTNVFWNGSARIEFTVNE